MFIVSDRPLLIYELKSKSSYRSIARRMSVTETRWVDRADSNDSVAMCMVQSYRVIAKCVVKDNNLLPTVCNHEIHEGRGGNLALARKSPDILGTRLGG